MLSRRTALALPLAALAHAQQSGFEPLAGWTVVDGPESAFTVSPTEIVVHPHATLPTWLRSDRQYENFELQGEFFIKGWTDSGLYLHAPEHGRPTQAGLQIKIFHQAKPDATQLDCGAIFPAIAPRLINVRQGWNSIRVLCDYPTLRVWINDTLVHDLNSETHPDLKLRLRSGYIGIAAASAACRFRNLSIKTLPSKESWQVLYERPEDLEKNWTVSEGKPDIVAIGSVLRGDGAGHLATRQKFGNFHFMCYVRGAAQHNGGIIFRSAGRGTDINKSHEIQLHPVEEAHFPTGSLYHLARARYPRIENEKWFLLELRVYGRDLIVRVDGDTILETSAVTITEPGFIELQTHRRGYWLEWKHVRVRPL